MKYPFYISRFRKVYNKLINTIGFRVLEKIGIGIINSRGLKNLTK